MNGGISNNGQNEGLYRFPKLKKCHNPGGHCYWLGRVDPGVI